VKKLLSALAAASLVAIMMTSGALATHVIAGDTVAPNSNSHAFIAGNPQCGAPAEGGLNFKLEDGVDLTVGTHGPIDITYVDGTYVSWAINAAFLGIYDSGSVIVKGGPNSIEYQYSALANDPTNPAVAGGLPGVPAGGDAAGGPDDADYRLTAPFNKNGKYYGLSHIEFCLDPKA
jgi:hypothetical protein